jgi:nucleoprotein TPR
LESDLQALKSSSSSSTSEVSAFKSRIASLESSNRDTLSLLESKCKAYDELTSELSIKHQKTIELRQEISALEQSVRSANATASSSTFREQNLHAEVDSLKRNNDWLEQELKTKSTEYSKFRKERNARVAELQRANEEAVSTIELLQRSETTLKQRLEEVNQKAEDFLSQIQQLKEDATRQEENFRSELDTSNRLTELLQNSVETERRRQRDLSEQLDKAKEDAAEEIGRINAEIETEHHDRIAAERRVAELEILVERLEADVSLQENPNTRPGTPNHVGNGKIPATPRRLESPARFLSPNSSKLAGSLSMTQMITDYHSAKTELEAEKARNEKLTATIDELIQEMESHQPEVSELRADHDRLEADVLEMSEALDSLQKERDQARKDARISEGKVTGLLRESEILRQQLRDISSQVKVLLIEIHAKDQGLNEFTPEERRRLEQLAHGEVDENMMAGITATDHFISQHLTTFKNISDLEEQNLKLLKIVRQLGDQLEGEEAQREKTQASQNQEELEDLRQKYERCKDEMRSLVTQSQSYIRERDMFRRMLAHRGQLPPGGDLASMFGASTNGSPAPGTPGQNGILHSIEQSPNAKDLADYAKLIKEMQSHFDSYRQEAATDRSTLKAQVDSLSKTNTELRNEVSRRVSEVTIALERYEILQGNYAMLRDANAELQKRSQTLSERAAAQELKTQQVAEDLVETKGLLESMRSESANLKAEKEFWKGVEKRLVEDNNNLLMERDRLNKLNADLQTISNQREQSDRESQRRLQARLEAMEADLQATNRRLNAEIEEGKRIALRREFESKQNQSRINDLVASLGSAREELVAAKSARDHLQARVDELTVELRSAEERVNVLKPQQPVIQGDANVSDDNNSSTDQEYALQISELRRDIELANRELANARSQIEQYKAISQASEEELQSINETQDQYRQEMDQHIEEKSAKIRELEQLVEVLRSEISSTRVELASLQSENVESNKRLDEQRSLFESEIARLKDSSERSESAAHFYKEDLKAQAEIARQAQQNYDNELIKHGEAAKTLQKLRSEYNQLRLEVAELKADAEAARSNLSQGEESWAEAKERYEREIAELRSRRDDIQSQNKLLHQQLEHVSNEISALQRERSPAGDGIESPSAVATSSADNTNELIRYLRREKEIVEVQWELASQETKRLRQTLEHTQAQLDEARLKLTQLRRAEENNERSALNHNKLLETIHELNLNRESNVTLRLEKNQAEATLQEKLKIIEELQEQIQPLQAKVRELEDAQEIQEEELRMTREARERFEQRYHDLLNRSNSVDPAEFETMKEEMTSLRSERDNLLASVEALQQQVDSIPDQIKQTQDQANERFQESRSKLVEQSKAKAREQSTKIREKDAALQGITQEKEFLEAQLRERQQELDAAIQARDEALAAQRSEDGQLTEVDAPNSQIIALEEKLNAAIKRAEDEGLRSSRLQEEVAALQARVTELQMVVVSTMHII